MRDWLIQLHKDLTVDTVLFPVELAVVIFGILCFLLPAISSYSFPTWIKRLAARRYLAIGTVFVVTLGGHWIMEPSYRIPAPGIHDEFSYLLAAETFASGRITNPPHPMRYFFESFHTLQEPSYMSMYPPGQGLALALGILLAGHPIWGVWISASLLAAAVCWMLQGWSRSSWALVAGLLCAVRIGWFSYWSNSYWGGAVPALGGALLIGAAIRLSRRPTWQSGSILALSILILANTRLWEGTIAVGTVGAWLIVQTLSRSLRWSVPALVAIIALLIPGGCLMLYYNYRITGSATRLPYLENRGRYEIYGSFVWDKPRPNRHYNHPVLRRFYEDAEGYREKLGYWWIQAEKPERLWIFFVGPALTPLLLGIGGVFRSAPFGLPILMVASMAIGHLLVPWHIQPHYAAPITGAIYLLFVDSARRLVVWRRKRRFGGRAIVYGCLLACMIMAVFRTAAPSLGVKVYHERTNPWYSYGLLANFHRERLEAKLLSTPGRHLVLIQYGTDHYPDIEWVYNHANIDDSSVVWARHVTDRSRLNELLKYYKGRTVWIVKPDSDPEGIVEFKEEGP